MSVELSVITPVLNGIAHIGPCIDNVIAQGALEIEHLIVDGGSTDGTVEFVRQAMQRHPHIRLIEGPDRGQSHAMNKGVVFANAPILGTLNVDDRYYPGVLSIAIRHLKNAPEPAFLWGTCVVKQPTSEYSQRPGRFDPRALLMGHAFHQHPVNPCSYFYHRSLHFRAGLFDENDDYSLDVDFLIRAAFHVDRLITVTDALGEYRMMPGTKTYENELTAQRLERLCVRYIPSLTFSQRTHVTLARRLRHLVTKLYAEAAWLLRFRLKFQRASRKIVGFYRTLLAKGEPI